MVAQGTAGNVNIFTLDGPTATGNALLRAAATFTAQNTRGLSAGFDLQARFEGAVDAKLADGVKAAFRSSGSVAIGAEASAYFPMDIFDFAGVVATLKAQAEARASVKLDLSFRANELLEGVLADTAGSLWRPYVDVVTRQVGATAGLYASAAVCVKATAETRIGIRLFPKAGEPAGTVFVINFGYGFIYGYSWGLIAELSFPDPANLVREIFGVSSRQLAAALDAESARRPDPMRSVLAEAADVIELVLPGLAGVLCALLADAPADQREARVAASASSLATQLGQHLLERLVAAAIEGLGTLLVDLGLPTGVDAANSLMRLLHAVEDAVVAGRNVLTFLPEAIEVIIDALVGLTEQALAESDREIFTDVVVGIWAGVSLLESNTGSGAPTGALRRLLAEQGIDVKMTGPGELPAQALARSAARLLRRAGAAAWLTEATGIVLEDLLRMPMRGLQSDPVQFLRSFLAGAGAVISRELLDELPLSDIGLPVEAVESIRSILRVATEELPDLLGDLSDEQILKRLRERVSVGLLQTVGPPLVAFLEKVAREGFDQAVPALRRLEAQARDVSDLIPQFPSGGPLDRFTSALEDLGRESIDVTLGLPTSVLLGHLASKLDRWRTERLPVELALMKQTVGLQGQSSSGLLAALDSSDTAVALAALGALAEHHLEQILSITQFLIEDSADLLVRLTTLPFEQAARMFAASVKFAFELTAAVVAELDLIASDVDRRVDELQTAAARSVADLAGHCAELAQMADRAVDEIINDIISGLVGNDPVARTVATLAFNAVTGGVAPVIQRMLGDVSTVLRVASESIAAAAKAGTLDAGGALSVIELAIRGTASHGVSVPITILVPVVPPFFFVNVTVATVSVPAEWLGLAVWNAITGLTGAGPLIAAIDDTAQSLQLTHAAIDSARALGSGDQIRQRARDIDSQMTASLLNMPISVEFDAGNAQSVSVAGSSTVVTGRISGIDRSYVLPLAVGDAARSTVIPARIRFTCQGHAVPPEVVTWTEKGPGVMAFSFAVTARATADPSGATVRPGVCVVTCVAAMGAWGGMSDDVGISKCLTLLLVPDSKEAGKHTVVEGWVNPDGSAQVVYLGSSSRATDRALLLLTRQLDGTWSLTDVTAESGAEAACVGSGLTGWTDVEGEAHLVYAAASGGLWTSQRNAGIWTTQQIDDGGRGGLTRTGRPVRLEGTRERLAYVNERGQVRLAERGDLGDHWEVTEVSATAGLPPAAAASGLLSWESVAAGSNDLVTEGNLLQNPDFAEGARNPWEYAAAWTGWTGGRADRVMLTDLRPSTLPVSGSKRMLHVSTTINNAGVVQAFAPHDTGPDRVVSAAWIYLTRGEVGIGVGNSGRTAPDTRTSEQGRWIRLIAPNADAPANEFVVYATSEGGAEFSIAGASVRVAGTPAPLTTTNLVYGGADGHLYRIARESSSPAWQLADLTLDCQLVHWREGTDLTTWPDQLGGQHISFWATDGLLYALKEPAPGVGWSVTQLSEPTDTMLRRGRARSAGAGTTFALGPLRALACAGPDGAFRVGVSVEGDDSFRWLDPVFDGRTPPPSSRGAVASWVEATGTASVVVAAGRRISLLSSSPDLMDWSVIDLTAGFPPVARD